MIVYRNLTRAHACTQAELNAILKDYVGRETPLYYAERLSKHYQRFVQ